MAGASSPAPASASHGLAYALIFVTPALWCVNYLVARWAPGHVTPHVLAFGRWLIAAGLLAALTWPELRRQAPFIRSQWRHWLVLGALGMSRAPALEVPATPASES